MNIPITAEDEEMFENTGSYENCIFCDEPTKYWYVSVNRPVCPVCSVLNSPGDISTAPYNY